MEHNKLMIQLGDMNKTTKIDELLYAEQLDNRELFLGEVVDDDIIYDVVHHIIRWNREDNGKPVGERKPIKLYINSYGGDVHACFSAIETIKRSETPVYTYNLGKAWSAGGLLLMAGHRRFTYKDAVILIHQGSSGAQGTTGQVIDQVEFQKRIEERIKEYVLNNTKITEELYKEKYKEEFYFFGDEAVNLYGVADELIETLDILV
jgi:ATP-dependent Clp protease protease subunit